MWRALALKEARIVLRDKHALAVLFLMPALFLVLMALAMGNITRLQSPQLEVYLTTHTDSDSSRFFALALERQLGTLQTAPSNKSIHVQLPQDFDQQLLNEQPSPIALLIPARADNAARHYVRGSVDMALAQTRLMAFLLDTEELDPSTPLEQRLETVAARTQSHVYEQTLQANGQHTNEPNASQHNVPAWLIFGMFFVMLPMASSFQREQLNGTLLRLRCLDLSLGTWLLSKLPIYLAINFAQFGLLLSLGLWCLPLLDLPALELPGSPWAYVLLALCLALTTCSLGLALAALARSTEQALMLSGGLNILLAAIGGIMVPKSMMPELMQQLAEISPMSWALDAFLTLLVGQGTLGDILPYCLRLLVFSALACALGLLMFHRRLRDTQWTTHY